MTALPKLNLQDVKSGGPASAFVSSAEPAPPAAPPRAPRRPTSRPTTPAADRTNDGASTSDQAPETPRAAFYGAGAVEQTSIAIEPTLYETMTEVARAARVPSNTLFLATVNASLPATASDAVKAIVGERANHPGRRREYTPRVPLALRARVDELVAAAREHVSKVTRADLVNATLREGLPTDAHQAAELVAAWERNRELSQLPAGGEHV
jgi:hypothetical protein